MHPINIAILEQFRRNPSGQYTTTQIVRNVFFDEFQKITYLLRSQNRFDVRLGLQKKAQLHRKLLYHMNKLVDDNLLSITDVRSRGEKIFMLAMEQGELVIKDKTHHIVISKFSSVGSSLDRYAQKGLIVKHTAESWLSKQQAIMLDGESIPSPTLLLQHLNNLLPITSDVLAINRFEMTIVNASYDEIVHLLASLSYDANDHDASISLLVNLDRLSNEHFLRALTTVLPALSRKINFVFTLTPKTMTVKESKIRELFTIFSRSHRTISFKNHSIYQPPIFHGGSSYALVPEDYSTFKERVRGISPSCVIGNLGVVVDIKRHFLEGGSISDFRMFIQKICHGLFEVDEQKRNQHKDTESDLEKAKAHFRIARHYIRFWNWHLLDESKEFTFDLLESLKRDIDDFCDRQETIFRSCGLPIRFRIGLSTAFKNFDQNYYSDQWLRKTTISSLNDLQTKKMKEYLRTREQLTTIFNGADRVRFFVDPTTALHELLSMSRHLLNAHNLPSFTFNFRGRSGDLSLHQFIEGTNG